MTLLNTLLQAGRHFRGRGVNHEQEAFTGELQVEPLVGGAAVLLRYRATLDDGTPVHEECTLLAPGPDGRPCLWPVMSELPVVLPHPETGPAAGAAGGVSAVFASGPRDETQAFREEITVALAADGSLTYAHAWGLPGGEFAARSSCRMAPVPPAAATSRTQVISDGAPSRSGGPQ